MIAKLTKKDKSKLNPKSSLRIAFVVGRFPVLSEAFILNQIDGLIERGHQVDIYALEGYSEETKVHPIVTKYNLSDRGYYVPQIPDNYGLRWLKALQLFVTRGWRNLPPILRSLNIFKYGKQAASGRLFYGAIAFLEQLDYDIVHCQFGIYALQGKYPEDAGVLALRSLGLLRGKLIVAFRGWDISWYLKEKGDRVYDELFKIGDFLLTNCQFFRDRAIKIGCPPEKIMVHGSGIDCQKFRFTPRYFPDDGLIRLVTTGRLVEKKGIEYSIRAVATLIRDYPNLEYKIVGDGCLRQQLQQLITELGVGDNIKLLGWQQQQEIISILDNSHIFIAPCVTAQDGNQDAPVNTLKEAMAMGLPVIATLHGGIPELVKDGVSGCLVPERDAVAIATKLRYLIENPDLWQNMGLSGRKFVEQHYDINQLNDELIEIYYQLLINQQEDERSFEASKI
jgi:colanic acid/amylovoran biosynthesis glycosyltransferase